MGEITVRSVVPADYTAVGRLTVDAYRADGQLEAGTGYERVLADVERRAADRAAEVLVAVDDSGTVVGSVTLALPGSAYADLAVPGETEFRMLAVDRAAQGRGVGELLVRACCARAVARGARTMVISVRDFSIRAQRLYQRLGFIRLPERDWTPVHGVSLLTLRLDLDVAPGRVDPSYVE